MAHSVLSDKQILTEIKNTNVFIHPFNEKNLSNSSYDVTLGLNYYRAQKSPKLFLPWNEESIHEYWGNPQVADLIDTEELSEKYKLPIGSRIILLEPGELILAHTQEFIGGLECITTMMKARSTMGRIGISVCKDAGWGDVGYINRWCMEVSNFSQSTIPLVVGMRIAQIVFFYTGKVMNTYHKKGAYQTECETTDEILRKWETNQMLPKFRF
jgi:dCTP deaminase